MYEIRLAQLPADRGHLRELWREYAQALSRDLAKAIGIRIDVEARLALDMEQLGMYAPPDGCLVLATVGSCVVGSGALRKIGADVGEIKRMVVSPQYRRNGIGRTLLARLIDEARIRGYRRLRLDTSGFMEAAQALYRSAGFVEIRPYPQSEVPEAHHDQCLFFEKRLDVPDGGRPCCARPATEGVAEMPGHTPQRAIDQTASPCVPLAYRRANLDDVPLLALLNHQLTVDEGHPNQCRNDAWFRERMARFLTTDYVGVLFEADGEVVGYALYRDDPTSADTIHLRQLLIERAHRRKGYGRQALRLLMTQVWPLEKRITLEVLPGNRDARAFYDAIGFRECSIALEFTAERRALWMQGGDT